MVIVFLIHLFFNVLTYLRNEFLHRVKKYGKDSKVIKFQIFNQIAITTIDPIAIRVIYLIKLMSKIFKITKIIFQRKIFISNIRVRYLYPSQV